MEITFRRASSCEFGSNRILAISNFLIRLGVFLLFISGVCAAQSSDPDPITPTQPASPIATQNEEAPYEPTTDHQRFDWFLDQSFGPQHVAGNLLVAAYGTARNSPPE